MSLENHPLNQASLIQNPKPNFEEKLQSLPHVSISSGRLFTNAQNQYKKDSWLTIRNVLFAIGGLVGTALLGYTAMQLIKKNTIPSPGIDDLSVENEQLPNPDTLKLHEESFWKQKSITEFKSDQIDDVNKFSDLSPNNLQYPQKIPTYLEEGEKNQPIKSEIATLPKNLSSSSKIKNICYIIGVIGAVAGIYRFFSKSTKQNPQIQQQQQNQQVQFYRLEKNPEKKKIDIEYHPFDKSSLIIKNADLIEPEDLKSFKFDRIEFRNCNINNIGKLNLSNLKSLTFYNCKEPIDFIDLHFPHLEYLKIDKCIIKNFETLELPNLKHFHFLNIPLINNFNFLLNFNKLEEVTISNYLMESFIENLDENLAKHIKKKNIHFFSIDELTCFSKDNKVKKFTPNFLILMNYIKIKHTEGYKTIYNSSSSSNINQCSSICDLQKVFYDFYSDFYFFPLNYALYFDDIKMIDLALEAGANVNQLDDNQNNILYWLAVNKNIKTLPFIEKFIVLGVSLTQKNKSNVSPLDILSEMYPITNKFLDDCIIKQFDKIDENNQQALFNIIQKQQNINEINSIFQPKNGQTLFHRAISEQNIKLVELLLKKGANSLGKKINLTPLEFAIQEKIRLEKDTSEENYIKKNNINNIVSILILESLNNKKHNSKDLGSEDLLSNLPPNAIQLILNSLAEDKLNKLNEIGDWLNGKSLSALSQTSNFLRKKVKSLIPRLLNSGKITVYDLVKGLTKGRYVNLKELEKLKIYIGSKNCQLIKNLDLTGCRYDEKDLNLTNFPILESLTLDGYYEHWFHEFKMLESMNLKTLSLLNCKYSISFSPRKKNTHLTSLCIKGLENICTINLFNHPNLKKLIIQDCPKLETLVLNFFQELNEDSISIENSEKLKHLELFNFTTTENNHFIFKKSLNLEYLNFKDSLINFNFLPECKKLKKLNFENCILNFNDKYNFDLTELSIKNCNLKQASFLQYFPKLKNLELFENPQITNFDFLLDLQDFKSLSLSKNQFKNFKNCLDENEKLVEFIKKNKIHIVVGDFVFSSNLKQLEYCSIDEDPIAENNLNKYLENDQEFSKFIKEKNIPIFIGFGKKKYEYILPQSQEEELIHPKSSQISVISNENSN